MNPKPKTAPIQSLTTIYLAERRGCTQTSSFRSFHTLDEERKFPGHLMSFDEETLAGRSSRTFTTMESVSVMLLPLIGSVNFETGDFNGNVEAGQCHIFTVEKNSLYQLSNPFQDDLISYLHCQVRVSTLHKKDVQAEFDVATNQNHLISIFPDSSQEISHHIGRYDGRREGTYRCKAPGNNAFVFIIEGAFEVQNRLLQSRDGLVLCNEKQIEFEALSNDAIILLMEI